MKKKKLKNRFTHLGLTLFLCSVIAGCGYSIHRHADLPFTEIKIGRIENKTLEPKLQDKLHRALTEEFLKQGISVEPEAELELKGIIHHFQMSGLSEKSGVIVEYQVNITADFSLTDQKGAVKKLKNIKSPFIVSFSGSQDLGLLLANRDLAEEKAARDVAMQIVRELIYQ